MSDAAVAPGPGVRWHGAQRDVLKGDLRGRVALDALASTSHLYALGPLEGVRGEVTILDSVPSIARIERDAVVTAASWDVRACFLVWAQVPAWDERATDAPVEDLLGLEGAVLDLADASGFDLARPLPFRVRGTVTEATLHVLDKRDALPHDQAQHERAKVRRTLRERPVELVGFHSRSHRGIFTPGDANVHVHLRTADGRISGHLESIRLAPDARVGVPLAGWHQAQAERREPGRGRGRVRAGARRRGGCGAARPRRGRSRPRRHPRSRGLRSPA
jgi:acetolactate decarboxylase